MLVASMAYYTDYVLGDAAVLGSLLGVFFAASIVSVPVWVSLGNRFEKKQLALWAMCGIALVLSALLVLGEGDLLLMHVVAVFGGAAGGCLDVVFPSIQADVIDFDEYQTGERKEGVYFSVWALAAKTAAGLAGLLIGLALSVGGFVPNAEQSDAALLAIRLMVAAAPVACYSAGTLIFLRFRLDRRAHEQIRVALDARAHPGS